MDEQQSQFYFSDFINQQEEPKHHIQLSSPIIQPSNAQPLVLKAFNPYQFAQNLPQKQQQKYLNMMMHNKTYTGLTHFINFDKSEQIPDFFNSIKLESYGYKDWTENPWHLEQLFQNQDPQTIKRKLQSIQQKISEINKKTFSQISINHLIIPSFRDNFDNYFSVGSHQNFIKDFQNKFVYFGQIVKKNHDEQLIVQIYQFWLSLFQQFVLSLKKHNQRYTLNIFKKLKDSESTTHKDKKSNHDAKSSSSSRMIETQKRRAWKTSELQLIQKVIQSNNSFNQSIINKLAEQLKRSPASITSKIQKILKDHKAHNPDYEVHQNMTLIQKVINVLKNYQHGLSRQSVVQRVKQHYEMGYDLNWQKSVAQILSSRPQFVKIKGTYSLIGSHKFDMSKKTFKDKVVNCLLKIPGERADIKRIVDQYINLYGMSEGISILSDQRRKTIEASISKSLCRYDIFDKESSKTVYKLAQFCDQRERQMEIQSYIS